MVVCFDFDGVLSDVRVQRLCKKCVESRCEIWVVTARSDNDFNRKILKPVLDKLFLSFSSVIFCNNKPKFEILESINADLYIDNENNELDEINEHTNIIALKY